jgi:hypothetical protein
MSSISGNPLPTSSSILQANQKKNDNVNNTSQSVQTPVESVSPIISSNPDTALAELLNLYSQITQKSQTNPSSTSSLSLETSQGTEHKGNFIPPGLAKRAAEDLPDGNPWKNSLGAREAAITSQSEEQKQAEQQLQQTLFLMILNHFATLFSSASKVSPVTRDPIKSNLSAQGTKTTTEETTKASPPALPKSSSKPDIIPISEQSPSSTDPPDESELQKTDAS